MKQIPSNIKAVLMDLDGTLFDSMDVWLEVDKKWSKKHNVELTDDYTEQIMSKSFLEAARYTIDLFGLDMTEKELMQEWNDMARQEYATLEPKPLTKEYLIALKSAGLKLAVVTSLLPDMYEPLLKNCNFTPLFDEFCSTNETGKGKDFPNIYLLAAKKLGVKTEECLVFEDILQGVKSAKSIGMKTVAVYDKSSACHKELLTCISDGYIKTFDEAPMPDISARVKHKSLPEEINRVAIFSEDKIKTM